MNSSPSRILDQTDLMPARSSSNNSLPKDVTDETDTNANEPNLHAMSRYVQFHSTAMGNLTKVWKTETGPSQGGREWSRGPESELFEILPYGDH